MIPSDGQMVFVSISYFTNGLQTVVQLQGFCDGKPYSKHVLFLVDIKKKL